MLKHFVVAILIFSGFSCQTQQTQKTDNSTDNKIDSMSNSLEKAKTSGNDENFGEIVESFTDDTDIGIPHKNKIEIFNITQPDVNTAKINFYSLTTDKEWKLKQTFTLDKDKLISLNPKVKDFNNDGLKDFTYVPATAGRGANELQRLFIYDKKKDELVYVKNSEEYPNLRYNKRLNSLTAQRFYGDTTVTEFLNIEEDLLKKFASVESKDTERTVFLVDKNGKEKLLKKYKINGLEYLERFKNFNPLEFDDFDDEQ